MKNRNHATSRAFTGAWIETTKERLFLCNDPCRAFTGAWIETCRRVGAPPGKPGRAFTGAWIETPYYIGIGGGTELSRLHGRVD